MTFQRGDARASWGLEARWTLIMDNLRRYYEDVKNPLIQGDFETQIWQLVQALDDPAVGDLVEIIRQFVTRADRGLPTEQLIGNPLSALIVAVTYCCRARRAGELEGNRELGWIYLAEASFWCGVTLAGKGIDAAYRRTLVESRSQTGKKGPAKRDESLPQIIEYAQKLARDKRPSGGWSSRNHAIKTIYEAVNEFAKGLNRTYSKSQAEDTMGGWLSLMPDAAELFPQTQSKKKRG
ncbi:Uncharacterised protein [Burkholderia pseudomallei]|nr:Uncharacterised protein [Burkholderia pseudomallei]